MEWSRLRHGTPNEFNWYWCFNYAAIGYNKSLSDNLFADVALHAMKLSTPRHVDETFGISGKLSYSFNSRMSLHVFGGFYLLLLLHSAVMTTEAVLLSI